MRFLLPFLIFSILLGCKSKIEDKENVKENNKVAEEMAPLTKAEYTTKLPVYDFEGLRPFLNKDDGKTYIINFWATWCKPCVEEMPYFERTYAEQQTNGVELILVSLDMPSMWQSRLEPFVEKKSLKGEVIILDDPKMNDWIPKVDPDWGGGIPATLIYNREKRAFFERGFTYEELNEELKRFM